MTGSVLAARDYALEKEKLARILCGIRNLKVMSYADFFAQEDGAVKKVVLDDYSPDKGKIADIEKRTGTRVVAVTMSRANQTFLRVGERQQNNTDGELFLCRKM